MSLSELPASPRAVPTGRRDSVDVAPTVTAPTRGGFVLSKARILKDTFGYSASALAAQAIGLVSGLWVARHLVPADFGTWNAVSLVIVYGAYVDFGVLSALGRDLPYRLGQGDQAGAASLDAAARWATIGGAIVAATCVVFASFVLDLPPAMRIGLRTMAAVLVLQQTYSYHCIGLRAHSRFSELSRLQFLLSMFTGALAMLLVTVFGLVGRFTAALLAQGLVLLYAVRRLPWKDAPAPRLREALPLAQVGMTITLSGLVLSLVTTVDRLMVLTFLDQEALGFLGLALLVNGVIAVLPQMANQVLYPRITYRFGESGRDVSALRSFVLTPPLVLAAVLPLIIGPAFLVLPVLVRTVLPAYVPGLTAMRIIVLGSFFFVTVGLTDYFLVTIGKLRYYAAFGGAALLLNLSLDYAAIRLGYGIDGVALAGTPITYFLYSSLFIGFALSHYTRDRREWLRYFGRIWLPFAYMGGLLLLVEQLVVIRGPADGAAAGLVEAGSRVALYLLLAAPVSAVSIHTLRPEWSRTALAYFRTA